MAFSKPSQDAQYSLLKILHKLGFIDTAVLNQSWEFSDNFPISQLAIHSLIKESEVLPKVAASLNIELINVDHPTFTRIVNLLAHQELTEISDSDWSTIRAVPYELKDKTLTVAFANPLDMNSIRAIEFETGFKVKSALAKEEHINSCLARRLPNVENEFRQLIDASHSTETRSTPQLESNLTADTNEAPVIRLVNRILGEAVHNGASDIHLSPEREQLEVRIRVDGIMRPLLAIPSHLQGAVSSRIKILAGMDISEKRRPQDGRLRIKTPIGVRDLRLSSIPTAHGENIVIRILSADLARVSFESLGLKPREITQLTRCLTGSSRVVLVTGPTGSGKTSTLYACLLSLKNTTNNIITIEDPIEYRIPGLSQTQVNSKIGVGFAQGLRAVLRQDPDVVMVGEIRDQETAQIAFQAAQTGHLVLSTLHTNSAAATIVRLRDIGLPSYIIASSLGAVVAQRLVRKLCKCCSIVDEGEKVKKYNSLGILEGQVKRAVGCDQCNQTGYKGRVGIYSFLEISDRVRDAIRADRSENEIEQAAKDFRSLLQSSIEAINEGTTSIDEVERSLGSFEIWLNSQPNNPETPGNELKKVLLIEDDENVRTVLSLLLQNAAYEVIEACDGREAIGILQNTKPDLIVSDLMMPRLDGYGVVRHIRSNNDLRKLPILILTAAQTEDNEIKLLDIGADDFVGKSADPKILLSRVSRLLSRQE